MAENDVIDALNETEEEEEDVITCPVCGEEVEPGTENCPLCGAPVGALENNDISGTSIDNSAAIDAMLQSAAMLVEESTSLGVALDDEEDDDTDEEGMTPASQEDEEPAPVVPVDTAAAAAVPSAPPEPQNRQTETVVDTVDPPPSPKAHPPRKKGRQVSSGAPTLYDVDEKGNPISEDDDLEEAPYTPPARKSARQPKNKNKNNSKSKDRDNNREKNKSKDRNKPSSPVLVIVTAVVALALGCAVGFFGKLMFFPDIVLPECQEFAERAVLGVNSVVDGEIYIAEAYVKESGDTTQCVFRAITHSDGDTAEVSWFRVKVYSDAPDTLRVYFQLDMDRYNALINSDNEEQHVQASVLMSNQQELERCLSEIQSGAGGWNTANAGMLNETLRPTPKEDGDA